MAWWQKKLLRYALSRTGLLEDRVLDLDNLDITLGKKNVVELKDLGLNIKRISKFAQLPPSLRIETARVLSLRLTVPADIYQSGIVAEVDGVELSLKLDEKSEEGRQEQKTRERSPANARGPQHRKVQRRLHSPPPYDPGGSDGSGGTHIPTAEELAKSFLLEEPVQERRELEASVAATSKRLDESIASESSESDDYGTGGAIGLPGFLAGFLQGIVDRMQVKIKNVEAKLESEVSGDSQSPVPVTLRLHVGAAELASLGSNDDSESPNQQSHDGRRHVKLQDLSLSLLSDAEVFSELSDLPSHASPTESRQRDQSTSASRADDSGEDPTFRTGPVQHPSSSVSSRSKSHSSPKSPDMMRASIMTADDDRFADAGEEDSPSSRPSRHSDLDIQPGDDNISWGSRRSKTDAPPEDLWNSMVSEDDLPESLLLERAPTPRARSSGTESPTSTRNQRDVSPYLRSLQSPGSWPRLDDSPPRNRSQQSPGSWPTLDQSQHSMYQPLTAEHASNLEEPTDNKRAALLASAMEPPQSDTPPETDDEVAGDLMESRLFSHEEAESMYMSAMTHSPKMHIPGGWGAESEHPPSPIELRRPSHDATEPTVEEAEGSENHLAYGEQPYHTPSGNVTPRARSPEPSQNPDQTSRQKRSLTSVKLIYVDIVSLLLPNREDSLEDAELVPIRSGSPSVSKTTHHMPGTFSAYSEMAASQRKLGSSARDFDRSNVNTSKVEPPRSTSSSSLLGVEIGVVQCQLDVSSCRLLHRLANKSTAILNPSNAAESDHVHSDPPKKVNQVTFTLSVRNTWVALRSSIAESLGGDLSPLEPAANLVTLDCRNLHVSSEFEALEARIGTFKLFLGPSCLLSFNRTRDMKTSMIMTEETSDVAITFATRRTAHRRPVMDITLETMPLDVLLDLRALDETFEPFGGLSGVLEAGNSMLSESERPSSSSSPVMPSKGVRFEGDPNSVATGPEIKVNGRLGGLCATLQGTNCSVQLRSTTVKAVYREQGAVATIEQVVVVSFHPASDEEAPLTVDLSTLRLEYLLSPQDKDLERLLSLLTPSKDKYDTDDDILLDTLLRQRRKGAVARAAVSDVKVKCSDLDSISALSSLSSELNSLSAVAKYLPEDERPGLLALIRVKEFEARLPVNERFGRLHVSLTDFHCAQVGLPALLALSIGNVKASQEGKPELVHALVHNAGLENLPLIMARMLGDEVEPTIKIKLFNLAFEYSVPVLLGLSGLDQNTETEEIVAELANSVAQLAVPHEHGNTGDSGPASDVSGPTAKKMNVDLLVHDSAVGLTPQNLASKALLVLADAHFSTAIPVGDRLVANLDIRKSGLFVADRVIIDDDVDTIPSRGVPGNTATKPKLTSALSKQGFISVGSIMAAKIAARITDDAGSKSKTIDVDVKTDLLLLETCADSTQTLIATLNALTPPTPPSKQPKYLTEPMTIEDMMASFTGDAYAKPERPPETLFDVEEEPEEDLAMNLDIPTLGEHDDDDGLLAESEMTSSLYGPISGMLEGVDKPEDDESATNDFGTTAESLLDDDPFEMPESPTQTQLSDSALIREINKQCKPARSDEPIDLGLYEIADLGYDALGGDQTALGTPYRFNTPATGKRGTKGVHKEQVLPFRLKLRDCHIIWNIYDGYDWQRTRDGITQVVEEVETRAEERKAKRRQSLNEDEDEESVIGDFLFNSIYIGVPSSRDAQDLRRQINRGIDDLASETESVPMSGMSKPTTYSASGRPSRPRQRRRLKLERSREHKVAFELKGVAADVLVFPPDNTDVVSSVDIRVRDLEIFDNVPTSTWRKFLTHLGDDKNAREMSKPMAHIELLNVRTLENFAASEIVMHVSVLPLRLHVDQDALDFITRFFEFKDESTKAAASEGEQPFIQRLEVHTVDLCLDYKPKKVDYAGLRSGHTTEFMNFVILDAADIRLKHAIVYGIKGFEPLHKTLNDIWMPDVKRNQLPTILSGLAPVRSLVNIGSGVRDVVAIPVREYQKDGRIVRSIQKGAYHFGKTTASELARMGAKVAIGTQNLLQGAEGFLSPTSASPGRSSPGRRRSSDQGWHDLDVEEEESERRAISAYSNQPLGVLSGLKSARRYLEHDLLTARDALIAVQGEMLESASPGSAAAAVVKHAPTVILRPIIGTSRAVGTALLGVGNRIDSSNLRRVEDKYKKR